MPTLPLTKTHGQLRRAVAWVNAMLAARGLEKAPDKTFIGRIKRGFDYLGYRFGPAGLGDARFAYECARLVARALETVASAASPIPSSSKGENAMPDRVALSMQNSARLND